MRGIEQYEFLIKKSASNGPMWSLAIFDFHCNARMSGLIRETNAKTKQKIRRADKDEREKKHFQFEFIIRCCWTTLIGWLVTIIVPTLGVCVLCSDYLHGASDISAPSVSLSHTPTHATFNWGNELIGMETVAPICLVEPSPFGHGRRMMVSFVCK